MTAARGPRHPVDQGFTLLELLVAITLLGLLMAALFGGLRLGARVWETGETRLDASARVQIVQDFLRQRLAEAAAAGSGGARPRTRPRSPCSRAGSRPCASRTCCPSTWAPAST